MKTDTIRRPSPVRKLAGSTIIAAPVNKAGVAAAEPGGDRLLEEDAGLWEGGSTDAGEEGVVVGSMPML